MEDRDIHIFRAHMATIFLFFLRHKLHRIKHEHKSACRISSQRCVKFSGGFGTLCSKMFSLLDYEKSRLLDLPKVLLQVRESKGKKENKTQVSQSLDFDQTTKYCSSSSLVYISHILLAALQNKVRLNKASTHSIQLLFLRAKVTHAHILNTHRSRDNLISI